MDKLDEKLLGVIDDLSKKKKLSADKTVKSLAEIYKDPDYRHSYAKIYSKVTLVDSSDNSSLEQLSANIDKVLASPEFLNQDDNIKKRIKKLTDHIKLEINQFQSIAFLKEEIKTEIVRNNQRVADLDKKNFEFEQKIEKADKEAKKLQKDYVAILGVFASIVVAFVGGIQVLAKSVDSFLVIVGQAGLLNGLLAVSWIAGFWIVLIWLLLSFIAKICDRECKIEYKLPLAVFLTIVVVSVVNYAYFA